MSTQRNEVGYWEPVPPEPFGYSTDAKPAAGPAGHQQVKPPSITRL
jgi:uncharacterized protein (DUF2141 family)